MGNVTAQAELADMLFTHGCTMFKDRVWHVELIPRGDWRNPECDIVVKVYVHSPNARDKPRVVSYIANTRATLAGADVPADILAEMADYHLYKVMEIVEKTEAGEEPKSEAGMRDGLHGED